MSLKWEPIIERAAAIALSYSVAPTLRQVYYRLVAASLIPNSESSYKRLSKLTAEGRRNGSFPALSDGTRGIDHAPFFADKAEALRTVADLYRLDRTEGQSEQLWIVVEKATLSTLARSVADPFGLPVAALRGYDSQTLNDEVGEWMVEDGRPARIIYLGDFDPSGEDIERSFLERLTTTWPDVFLQRVAVSPSQIVDLSLIENPGKTTDSRARAFAAKYGKLVQVEVEAIDPPTLDRLLREAITPHIDQSLVDTITETEEEHRAELRALAE